MRSPRLTWLLPCLALLVAPALVDAQSSKPVPADPTSDSMMMAAGFLDGHPDLRFRTQGLDAYAEGDYAKAFERFRQAAYYGDKASQAILGEMLWNGRGTGQDRVMALVWMDLAAERGYPRFVNTRNGYWNALSPVERQRARDRSGAIHDEYGDAVADPRLAKALRRERAKMSGSRVGSLSSNVQIVVPGQGSIDGSKFYDPQYWDPKQYRAWHDNFWETIPDGTVTVGEPEKLDAISTDPAKQLPEHAKPR